MSLFSALNSATAGLRVIHANTKLVSDNVTRSDDPNRTRHILERTTDRTGKLVVSTYTRQTDTALRVRLEDTIAQHGGDTTRNVYLKKMGDLLGTTQGKPGLSTITEGLTAAWRQLETSPESDTAQREVIQFGDRLAREIRRVADGVEKIDLEMTEEIRTEVTALNQNLKDIDSLNNEIVYIRSRGEPADDLADRRDALIRTVNDLVGVRTLDRGDGRIAVLTQSGLMMTDATPVEFKYDGFHLTVEGSDTPVDTHMMRAGKIGALLDMRADNSTLPVPRAASVQPGSEIMRKIRSQLDGLAEMFTAKTQPGQPTSFADAYNTPDAQPGELSVRFFAGSSRFDIQLAQELQDGTGRIKEAAIKDVTAAMHAGERSFEADGVTVTSSTYASIVTTVVGNWSAAAKSVEDTAQLSLETKDLLETRYHSAVGVNIDEEVAYLQTLQTSYAATARVIQAINAMFEALERAV